MDAGWHKIVVSAGGAGAAGRSASRCTLLADDEEAGRAHLCQGAAGAARRDARQRPTPKARAASPATPRPTHRPCTTIAAVVLGCADCHGGDATVMAPDGSGENRSANMRRCAITRMCCRAIRKTWNYPHSANPRKATPCSTAKRRNIVRFVNPSDYRVARAILRRLPSAGNPGGGTLADGDRCDVLRAARPTTTASCRDQESTDPAARPIPATASPRKIVSPGAPPGTVTEDQKSAARCPPLIPLPTWQVMPPADIFRVFERGGRTIGTSSPKSACPNSNGELQKLEEPGRPDIKPVQSRHGHRACASPIPVLNIHKTRLNDPFMWFMGTNDQPGDYRQSGCAGCHVVYANDREPRAQPDLCPVRPRRQEPDGRPDHSQGRVGHPLHHDLHPLDPDLASA